MQMSGEEQTHGLQWMILFKEMSANIKCFAFLSFVRACKLLNETKNMGKFYNILFPLVVIGFKLLWCNYLASLKSSK